MTDFSKTIRLSNDVDLDYPQINLSPLSLNFTGVEVDDVSPAQTFIVSGSNMIANLVLTTSSNFIINTDNSNTQMSPLTINQVGGVIAPTTIYVKFAPVADVTYSNAITFTSTNMITQTLPLSGTPIPLLSTSFGPISQHLTMRPLGNILLDKSGNGFNVDIINNDIELYKGFPYKSKALIAQKVANFGLIPDDGNFWYTPAGVPNQIPVSSLYENVHYGNKIFCRMADQQLNINGEEVFEPRVTEIVTYSAALTGPNLVAANSYFNVPAEVTGTNAIWVDWNNGSDSNSGTKASRYKTCAKALTAGAGKTIYIVSGSYAETSSLIMAGTQSWKFIGHCPVTSTATPVFGVNGTASNYIQGAIITPPAGGRALYFIAGNSNIAFKCKLNDNATGSRNFQQFAGQFNQLKYCLFNKASDQPAFDLRTNGADLYGCHFFGTQTGATSVLSFNTTALVNDMEIRYNKFVNTLVNNQGLFLFNIAGNYKIQHNVIKTTGGSNLVYTLAGATMTGNQIWKYNNIQPKSLNSGVMAYSNSTNVLNYECSYNYIKIDNTNSLPNGVINIIGQPSPIVRYNYIDSYINCSLISINATSNKGSADISYNTLLTRADGAHIVLGSDINSTYDNCYNNSTIIGNKIYGLWYFNPAATSVGGHGIAVFNCIDVTVKYNYVNGANHLVVYKASDRVTAMANTNAVCSYNIGIDNEASLFPKTMSGIKFYNNTTYCTNPNIVNIAGGAYVLASSGPATNNEFKNNIFIDKTPYKPTLSLFSIPQLGSLSGFVSDRNVLYSQNNAIGDIASVKKTFSQWQALGYDLNSLNQDVPLQNILAEKFIPVTQINIGQNLGITHQNGLDVTTNWYPGTTILLTPLIIAKQQTGTLWQVGAYIK